MSRFLWSLAALLALTGCDRRDPELTDADPALWVVKDADTTVYLFGTIHVLKPRLGWFDEAVADAFARSDSLVLEMVAPPPAELATLARDMGTARGGPPLPDQLDPKHAKRLRDALDRMGQPVSALDHVEPWFAATTLAMLPIRELGYDPSNGAEEILSTAAEKAGKPIIGLETAREQLRYFDRLSPAAQRAMLTEVLDGLPKGAARLEQVIRAWAAGDADALGRIINADVARQPELEAALLTNRNRRWADWIEARMRTPGTVFVAVGAGHLAGRGSVQEMLAERKLEVGRVSY